MTALMKAAIKDNIQIVKLLLTNDKIDINAYSILMHIN